MFEFKWQLSEPAAQSVILRVHARSGWFGTKSLTVGEKVIYRRGLFAGIEAQFRPVPEGPPVDLKLVPTTENQWRPALFVGGEEIPERNGTPLPLNPARPALISVVVGSCYLLMLIMTVILPSTVKMLTALRMPHADRKIALHFSDPGMPELLTADPVELEKHPQNVPLTTQVKATGGTPPYEFEASPEAWPKGMTLDKSSGAVTFTPRNSSDYCAEYVVRDAHGDIAVGVFAVLVASTQDSRSDWPTIPTISLPSGAYGEPYEACLVAEGGEEPLHWDRLSGSLPKGISLDSETGCIRGTPERKTLATLERRLGKQLKPGAPTQELLDALTNGKLHVDNEHAKLLSTSRDNVWLLTDGWRRYILIEDAESLRVQSGGDYYSLTLLVTDSSYEVGDDIWPWVIPFIVTALSLIGYWIMRRWGLFLFAGLLVVELGLNSTGAFPISTMALVLQGLLLAMGLRYYRQMV
ncbi:MAG TPA: Ig domain-containing protein [Phycisphaerae bacterium]|nr:Ig domain-containing protein [Phycisphaerae bacterium]